MLPRYQVNCFKIISYLKNIREKQGFDGATKYRDRHNY